MTISFDKRLAELDAYLQMLIERSELLDKKLASISAGAERNGLLLIKSRLETLLGSIKHSIVLLQIAKVSIKTLPDSDTSSTGSATKRHHYSNNNSSSRRTNQSSSTNQEEDEEDEEDSDGAILANTTAAITASLKEQMDLKRQASTNRKNEAESRQVATPITSKAPHVATPVANLPASAQEDDDDTFYDAADEQQLNWDALYDEEEEDLGSLENQGSVIKHLMSQIRIGMDLTKVVLPTFILERRSLLEMYADFFAHPDLFSSIPDYETPEKRMIQLVKWYLSAFHAGRKSAVAKKPYNPILGEIFLCHWNLQELNNKEQQQQDELLLVDNQKQHHNQMERLNSTESTCSVSDIEKFSNQLNRNSLMFVAEQVSHHPPVSAFYAENREKLISCSAHIYTKSKYLGLSVGVHNIGEGTISLLKHKENYVCTFPSAYGRSILTVPWVELGGSVNISCKETGYSANIEFVTKPFYGGKKHRIVAEIFRPNKEAFMAIEGEWNGCMYSKSPPNSNDKKMFVDTTCLPVIKKNVRSISSQESFESRNVWKEVTRALKLHDVSSATAAKTFIEQRQRDLLKERIEKGIKWKTRYFEELNEGWVYAKPLAARLSFADSSNSSTEQEL